MSNEYKNHDKFMAKSVRVIHGPFKGTCGTAQMGYKERVKVALAAPDLRTLWFLAKDLTIIGCCGRKIKWIG